MTVKLLAHLDRVQGIVEENYRAPIMVDIDPVDGVCNLDCVWCCQAASRFSRKPHFMTEETMSRMGRFCAEWGVKAWRIVGDSEPLLNKNIEQLIQSGSEQGIDMGLITNGVFLERLDRASLTSLSWLGVSLDAARAETWARLKRSRPQLFQEILNQIRRIRDEVPELDISLKFLRWNPESCLTKKDFGQDVLKSPGDGMVSEDNLTEAEEIEKLASDLGVKARIKDAYTVDQASKYRFSTCRATPLGGVFDASHRFHLCCDARGVFVLTDDYTRNNWSELLRLWNGPKHRELLAKIQPRKCLGCAKHHINETLEHLVVSKNPDYQPNFI